MSDIAEVAGVKGSAVVANWRVRFPSFPEPRIGGSQPLFALDDVLAWLRLDGPRGREVAEPRPEWLWPLLVEAYARQAPGDARTSLVALVAVARLAGDTPEWRRVLEADGDPAGALRLAARVADREAALRTTDRDTKWSHSLGERLRAQPGAAAALGQLAETLDQLRQVPVDDVLAPVLRLEQGSQRRRPQRTQPVLARLMAGLADVQPDDTVLDPAAGEGDVLVAAHRASSRDGRSAVVVGQDLSADASFIAAVRLVLEHATGGIAEPADSVRDERLAGRPYSVVLLDPPVADRPASDRDTYSLSRWIDYAMARLRDGGRAVVVLPLHELVAVRAARRRPDQKLQAMLHKVWAQRSLEAVVVVPRGLRTDIAGPLAVIAMRAESPAFDVDEARVPVVAVRARLREGAASPVNSIVAALADGGAPSLRRFHHPDVDHELVAVADIFPTLEAMADGVERAAVPWRAERSSPSGSEPSADALGMWSFASANARRAAQLDPLMRRSADDAIRLHADMPAMAPDLDDAGDALAGLLSARSGDRSAAADRRLLDDVAARLGELRLAVQRFEEGNRSLVGEAGLDLDALVRALDEAIVVAERQARAAQRAAR